jgi:hypothetical protein
VNSQSLSVRLALVLAFASINACGDSQQATAPAPPKPAAATATIAAAPATAVAQPAAPAAKKSPGGLDMSNRTEELLNPDEATVVFLYQDLAGLTPPLDQWVELDNRVRMGDPRDRAAQREVIKAELAAAAASVQQIGLIRLSLQSANLSHYDPNYGEFLVRALSPGSVVDFTAFGQKVSIKFANGRTAQIWKVPPEQGQAIEDKLGQYNSNVKLDALLQIRSVVPGPGGGSIMTDILEYELRDGRDDSTIGRIKIQE